MAVESKLEQIYEWLLREYGPQGWWPVRCECAESGYHKENFAVPASAKGRWEVCAGAILTQNTAWVNVETVLERLRAQELDDPETLMLCNDSDLAQAIRTAGYHNQKAKSLKNLAQWFLSPGPKTRVDLLSVNGVGPETADSILLYAFHQPSFVIDAYTRRIFSALEIVNMSWKYEKIRTLFQANLPVEIECYKEYHALLVEHAKRYYRKGTSAQCPLRRVLGKNLFDGDLA